MCKNYFSKFSFKDIRKSNSAYDGFVVLHGTDTWEYTACVFFMMENLGKPVVITGTQVRENKYSWTSFIRSPNSFPFSF